MKRFTIASVTLLALLACAPAQAELRGALEPKQRTNGDELRASLKPLQQKLAEVTAQIVDAKQQPLSMAIWVSEDGYLLFKGSEIPRLEQCQIRWGSGKLAKLREVRRDVGYDLILAQAVETRGVTPAVFAPARDIRLGQWLVAPAGPKRELRLGVLSAQRRPIPGTGAAIGIRMDSRAADGKQKGVRIVGVAEDSPAAAAGLRANDWMIELAGESIEKYQRVHEIISKRQPGEEIVVRFQRDGEINQVQVRLASRTKVLSNWSGEDFANGGISIRTDGFAQVLQHDLPLHPTDMGGPLMDLEGGFIGINISRVDRVTTFALPSEIFWPAVQEWIKADRQKKP